MMKRCTGCKREKSTKEFNANRSRKDGLSNRCKTCNKTYAKAYQAAKVTRTGRMCRICRRSKPLDDFSLVRKGIRRRVCKECVYERKRKTRNTWGIKNRERLNLQQRMNRKNPELTPRFVLVDSRRSDKRKKLENDLTLDFVTTILKKACSYCGETGIRMTLDRIDNSKGHTQDNVQAACIRCNYLRRDMPYEAWLVVAKGVKKARKLKLFGLWLGKITSRKH